MALTKGNVQVEGVKTDGLTTEIGETSFGITLDSGFKIVFQRVYKEYWKAADGQGSFSRTMIPDVAITFGKGDIQNLLVLDAKYRIDEGISDALTSIHTYRDSLVEDSPEGTKGLVRGAYVVSPHLPAGFTSDWKNEEMPNRVFHPAYRHAFRFGAVTMKPGSTSVNDAVNILVALMENTETQPATQESGARRLCDRLKRRGLLRLHQRGSHESDVPTV